MVNGMGSSNSLFFVQVKGCNIRKWMQGNNSKFLGVMEALGALIKANKLQITFTE